MRKTLVLSMFCLVLLLTSAVSQAASEESVDFITTLYDLPLGQTFEQPTYIVPTEVSYNKNFWFYKGGLGHVTASLMINHSTNAIFKVQLAATTKYSITSDLLPVLKSMYLAPTQISKENGQEIYQWLYPNYSAQLCVQSNADSTFRTSFNAVYNSDFAKLLYALPLGKTYNNPSYMQSNGSNLTNTYWFYKGRLGDCSAEVTVKNDTLTITKVAIKQNSEYFLLDDLTPILTSLYSKPTDVKNDNQQQQIDKWTYNNYSANFTTNLQPNFSWNNDFVATIN